MSDDTSKFSSPSADAQPITYQFEFWHRKEPNNGEGGAWLFTARRKGQKDTEDDESRKQDFEKVGEQVIEACVYEEAYDTAQLLFANFREKWQTAELLQQTHQAFLDKHLAYINQSSINETMKVARSRAQHATQLRRLKQEFEEEQIPPELFARFAHLKLPEVELEQ